jgi:hypothetical protein
VWAVWSFGDVFGVDLYLDFVGVEGGDWEYIFCVYNCERECMYVNTPTHRVDLEYPRQVNFEIENFGVIIDIE